MKSPSLSQNLNEVPSYQPRVREERATLGHIAQKGIFPLPACGEREGRGESRTSQISNPSLAIRRKTCFHNLMAAATALRPSSTDPQDPSTATSRLDITP